MSGAPLGLRYTLVRATDITGASGAGVDSRVDLTSAPRPVKWRICASLIACLCHGLLAAAGGSSREPIEESGPVNVMMIMTDDQGAWSLGCYGNREGHTPNIDRLASEGLLFTRAFAATPVCSPSRLTFLSGKLPSQHGVHDYLGKGSFNPAATRFLDDYHTYSKVLAERGYTLGYCGKWHMGDDAIPQQGFTYWFTTRGDTYRKTRVNRSREISDIEEVDGFPTDVITDRALQFIRSNQNKLFFLQVGYHAPHTPYDYQPERYRSPYHQSDFPTFPDEPMHPNQIDVYRQYLGKRESKLSYMALVRGIDQNVGRLVDELNRLGLRDKTLVIFCSDQGFNGGHHGVWGKGNGTLPFNMFEESIRIPLIFNLSTRISQGKIVQDMVSTYDFLPTLLDYLGISVPEDANLPGRSYASILRGQEAPASTPVFGEYAYVRMIRTEQFKYVQRADGYSDEMYDLGIDACERRNVVGDPKYISKRNQLIEELNGWFESIGAPPLKDWRSTLRAELPPYCAR